MKVRDYVSGPVIDPLESRLMFAEAFDGLKIPILVYHRSEVLEEADVNRGAIADDGYYFRHQMKDLKDRGFDSISIEEYLSIRDTGQLPSGKDHPFMAIFDDATTDQIADATRVMNPLGFKGVTAIPSGSVGSTETDAYGRIFMSWSEIRTLVYTHEWDVASHSKSHKFMGVGKAGSDIAYYRNTQADLEAELNDSINDPMTGIEANVYSPSGVHKDVKAFVHPHDDVTARSLSAAESVGYRIAFGKGSFYDSSTATSKTSEEQFAAATGSKDDLLNGQLRRIAITRFTSQVDFIGMLNKAILSATVSAQYRPAEVHPTTMYLARDGSIMVGGAISASGVAVGDTVEVLGRDIRFNAVNYDGDDIVTQSKYLASQRPSLQRYNISAGGGNDTIYVTNPVSTSYRTIVYGGRGNDQLYGSAYGDYLNGGSGDDRLEGRGAADTLVGGTGRDSFYAGNDSGAADTVDWEDDDLWGSRDGNEIII